MIRKRLATFCVACLVLSSAVESALTAQKRSEEPLEIGSRLELFVDDYLVESMEGVRLKLHEPRSAGRVLTFDKPWEGVTSNYISVFKDDDRYRMYYRGSSHAGYTVASLLDPGERVIPEHDQLVCYAESQDGIHWKRPSLGLFEFGGSKENNIVWTGHDGKGSHCFMAFRDDNPKATSDKPLARISGKPVRLRFVMKDADLYSLRFR